MTTPGVPADLRGIARAAARGFLNEECALELLGHGQSLAYRVVAASGKYLLRVHAPRSRPEHPAFHTPRAIESECAWLQALSAETELVVQKPVPSPDGGYVLSLSRSGARKAPPCTLLVWVEGEPLNGKRTAQQATRLGELLATLHAHALRWQRPAGFERPTHAPEAWQSALARTRELVSLGITASADHALHVRAVDQCQRELAPLALQPERVGLIHADLHADNYVFHGDTPRPIDFGRAGFGPWLYDIAECLTHLGPARRRDVIDAYARRQPVEEADLRRIEGYFVASLIEVFGNHAPDPGEHEYLSRAVPAWAPHIQRFVDGTPFLFDL